MNRLRSHSFANRIASKVASRSARSTDGLRHESTGILRDVAYVLQLTRRIKAEMLAERDAVAEASV